MPALETVGDYIVECRTLLQDENGVQRYTDAELVRGLNIALLEARRLRADLFLSLAFAIPNYTHPADLATLVPIDPMYRSSFVYYVVGRMQLRDAEETVDARASALLNKFVGQLLTIQS